MPLYLKDNKLLLNTGKLAIDLDCCCTDSCPILDTHELYTTTVSITGFQDAPLCEIPAPYGACLTDDKPYTVESFWADLNGGHTEDRPPISTNCIYGTNKLNQTLVRRITQYWDVAGSCYVKEYFETYAIAQAQVCCAIIEGQRAVCISPPQFFIHIGHYIVDPDRVSFNQVSTDTLYVALDDPVCNISKTTVTACAAGEQLWARNLCTGELDPISVNPCVTVIVDW